jgi:hypothetical protein
MLPFVHTTVMRAAKGLGTRILYPGSRPISGTHIYKAALTLQVPPDAIVWHSSQLHQLDDENIDRAAA